MTALVELPLEDALVVILAGELSKIISDAENNEALFLEFLMLTMKVCGSVARQNSLEEVRSDIREIENWLRDHYITLRSTLPPEIKKLYLREIAFSSKSRRREPR